MNAFLHDLLHTFRAEIAQSDTQHPIFHGCWDWHSSVHGHWALLESAHLLQDEDSLQWLINRLRHPGILEEMSYLEDHPDFENPYGRAWFLRLMLRLEQLTGIDEHRSRAQGIADDLFAHLQTVLHSPLTSEYNNLSWAFVQLYAWAKHSKDEDCLHWLTDKTAGCFLRPKASLDADTECGEFFSLWGLQAYLIHTVLGPAVLGEWLEADSPPEVVQDLSTAHHLAINASRAWGLHSAYLATADEQWKMAYDLHVQASMELHPIWKHDRRAYTHWVPQFTLYAMLMSWPNKGIIANT